MTALTGETRCVLILANHEAITGLARLRWNPDDPAAITMDLRADRDGDGTTWLFALELLADAIGHEGVKFGMGDVWCRRVGNTTTITLNDPDGNLTMIALPTNFAVTFAGRVNEERVSLGDVYGDQADRELLGFYQDGMLGGDGPLEIDGEEN